MSFSSLCDGGDSGRQLPSPASACRNQSSASSDVVDAVSNAVPEFRGVDTIFRCGPSVGSVDNAAGLLGAFAPAMDAGMLEADQVQDLLPRRSSSGFPGVPAVSGSGDGRMVAGSRSSVSTGSQLVFASELQVLHQAAAGDTLMGDGEPISGDVAGLQTLHGSAVVVETPGFTTLDNSPPSASSRAPTADVKSLQFAANVLPPSATTRPPSATTRAPSLPHLPPSAATRGAFLDKSILGSHVPPPANTHACPQAPILPHFQYAATVVPSASGQAWRRPRMVALPLLSDIGQFSTDGRTVLLDADDVAATSCLFAGALVGRLFGRRIPFGVLSAELHRRWASFGNFKIVTLSSDCFFCLFDSVDARDAVLLGGPWVLFGQVLGIDRWTPTFSPCSSAGFCTPVWVRMPDLPLYSWSPKNIARVAALIGEPVGIDEATAGLVRASFARVCVRVDLSKPLKPGVWVDGPYGKFYQSLVYEGISVFCYRCGKVGHKESSCPQPAAIAGCSIRLASNSSPLVKTSTTAQASPAQMAKVVDSPPLPSASRVSDRFDDPTDRGVGPWMTVTHKKKGGRGKPSVSNRPLSSVKYDKSPIPDSAIPIGTGSDVNRSVSPAPIFSGFSTPAVGALGRSARTTKAQLARASKSHNQRMLGDLGPVALESRKRRKAPSLTDGGDASPSPTP